MHFKLALDDEGVRQLILTRLESDDWWVLVDIGESDLAALIHDRHYGQGAAGDFELLLGPRLGYFTPAFYSMRKTRMSAADLARCVADAGGEALPDAAYEQRAFLFAPRRTAPAVLVEQFYDWLEQGRRLQPRRPADTDGKVSTALG